MNRFRQLDFFECIETVNWLMNTDSSVLNLSTDSFALKLLAYWHLYLLLLISSMVRSWACVQRASETPCDLNLAVQAKQDCTASWMGYGYTVILYEAYTGFLLNLQTCIAKCVLQSWGGSELADTRHHGKLFCWLGPFSMDKCFPGWVSRRHATMERG